MLLHFFLSFLLYFLKLPNIAKILHLSSCFAKLWNTLVFLKNMQKADKIWMHYENALFITMYSNLCPLLQQLLYEHLYSTPSYLPFQTSTRTWLLHKLIVLNIIIVLTTVLFIYKLTLLLVLLASLFRQDWPNPIQRMLVDTFLMKCLKNQ